MQHELHHWIHLQASSHPQRDTVCPNKRWKKQFTLLWPLSEEVTDDDAVLIWIRGQKGHLPRLKLMVGDPLAKTKSPSAQTDAGRDPSGTAKWDSFARKQRANDSEPWGDRNVFTHFPRDPDCQVCRKTQTTRVKCKYRPLKRTDEIAPPTTF